MAKGTQIFMTAAQATIADTQKALVALAKREHARVMATDPRPARFTRYVDGRQGAAEETVKPDGVIRYVYPRLDEVVQFAMETLFDLSPVLSGKYRMSHTLFVEGRAVSDLRDYRGGEVAISNFVPYARKIELGIMNMRVEGSSKVYFQAAAAIKQRFGNSATVRFTYRPIAGGTFVEARGKRGTELRYPTLIIAER